MVKQGYDSKGLPMMTVATIDNKKVDIQTNVSNGRKRLWKNVHDVKYIGPVPV